MFVDFALLTEQQGELLDQIQYQVEQASEYIDSGNKDIEVAIDYQKAARRKQCCLIITLLLVAIGIMAATGMFNGGDRRMRRRLLEVGSSVWNVGEGFGDELVLLDSSGEGGEFEEAVRRQK